MSGSRKTSRPYHHGNLRQALVEAAEAQLLEEGAAKLSLRAVARRTGVSQAAPYAHFDDRQALLAAVAARGFRHLCAYLRRAELTTGGSAERMHSLARGYVHFAVDHPMLFRLMFGTELSDLDDAELRTAAGDSYAFIEAAVAARLEEAGGDGVTAATGSLGAWSLVHGLAMLIVDGKVKWPASTAEQDALIDQVTGVYSAGLTQRVPLNH